MIKLHVLASGSKGNAAVIENTATGEGVLIDCGICKRDFFDRCAEAGFDPACLVGMLLTHEHTDHTKGLGVVLRGMARAGAPLPPLYVNDAVRMASADVQRAQESCACDVRSFRAGDALSLGGMQVHAFATSHDAAASFGFRFEAPAASVVPTTPAATTPSCVSQVAAAPAVSAATAPSSEVMDASPAASVDVLGFMTDTGVVTGAAHEALCGCRVLAIEGNHDVRLLENGPYPYPLKRRIASERGHLSNDQAACELEALLACSGADSLEQVVAMHISENNNDYRLPVDALSAVLERAGHSAQVQPAYQRMLVECL